MAQRVEIGSVTCPPNTPQANAIEVNLSFPPGVVREVEIVVPDGHAGVTGIALAQAHQIIIPRHGNAWIVANNEVIRWPLDGYINSGSWSAFVYNTSQTNTHSWYLRFLVDEVRPGPISETTAPIPAQDIIDVGNVALESADVATPTTVQEA